MPHEFTERLDGATAIPAPGEEGHIEPNADHELVLGVLNWEDENTSAAGPLVEQLGENTVRGEVLSAISSKKPRLGSSTYYLCQIFLVDRTHIYFPDLLRVVVNADYFPPKYVAEIEDLPLAVKVRAFAQEGQIQFARRILGKLNIKIFKMWQKLDW